MSMNEFRMALSASHGLGNGKTAHLEGLLEKSSTSSIDNKGIWRLLYHQRKTV